MPVFNYSNYKTTRNLSVDMCMEIIAFYRKANRPLRSIYLSKYHYDTFSDYFKKNGLTDDQITALEYQATHLELDSVRILRSELLVKEPYQLEFYPTKITEEGYDIKNNTLSTKTMNGLG
jgi:hypothetical protein